MEHRLLSLRIDAAQELLGHGRNGRLYPPHHRLRIKAANLDGLAICRMFNRVVARQTLPKYLSSDHDPLFCFHRWRANPRILEVDEIKAVPAAPRSHAFVERLIGTLRREYLDQTLFWNRNDLAGCGRMPIAHVFLGADV
jgi:hypothetical protein